MNLTKTKLYKLISKFEEGRNYTHAPSVLAQSANMGEYIDELEEALIEFYALATMDKHELAVIFPESVEDEG